MKIRLTLEVFPDSDLYTFQPQKTRQQKETTQRVTTLGSG